MILTTPSIQEIPWKCVLLLFLRIFETMKSKFYLLYKAKKWDFFFSTLCLFLENVFANRHFCLFYRFLDIFILICLLSYKNYIPSSLLYKKYISVHFSTHCLSFQIWFHTIKLATTNHHHSNFSFFCII